MTTAIIGYSGLVGSYLQRLSPTADLFNGSNSESMRHRTYDTVYFAGISATKWWANQNPEEDWERIQNCLNNVMTIECKKNFVLISTIDVFTTECQDERNRTQVPNDSYGKHRLEAERLLVTHFGHDRCYIVRLCGLFGFGLKKNIIFDFVNQRLTELDITSSFQWYSLEWLTSDIEYIMKYKIRTVNFFTEPVRTKKLCEVFREVNPSCSFSEVRGQGKCYNIQTIHGRNGSRYWRCQQAVITALRRYLTQMCQGNVVLSNLCTQSTQVKLLPKYGVKLLEVAPHKHFGAGFIDKDLNFFTKFTGIYSFQSLLYPNKWNLQNNFSEALVYLKKLIDIAVIVGAQVLVFGSPKFRSVGSRSLALKFFRKLADFIGDRLVTICIEPNARKYGCEFLVTSAEVIEFLEELGCGKQIKLVLDTGCMYMEQENLAKAFQDNLHWLHHVHFSAPNLKSLTSSQQHIPYSWLRFRLQQLGYRGKITIEMLLVAEKEIPASVRLVVRDPLVQVVGGGWMGCHLSSILIEQEGLHVELVEKNREIFCEASANNQNRLHQGFHYPRSYKTRNLCQRTFDRFLHRYGHLTSKVEPNYYIIAQDSVLDFETYCIIMQISSANTTFTSVESLGLRRCCPSAIQVSEKMINFQAAKAHFQTKLARYITLNHEVSSSCLLSSAADFTIDCTYNNIGRIENHLFVNTLSLVYKSSKANFPALTVMDGSFWSLYPYSDNNLFTLTHVSLGLLGEDVSGSAITVARTKMEQVVSEYLPTFASVFSFQFPFITRKCKLRSSCDSRELTLSSHTKHVSFISGKIPGIFDAQDWLVPKSCSSKDNKELSSKVGLE